jgi:hypothetical protein
MFLAEVAHFVEGAYCFATQPHVFVRYHAHDAFTEVPPLPSATYQQRGPFATWAAESADIALSLPQDAERVEVYAYFDRISYNGATCYLGYDMEECPDVFSIAGDYVSNYGKNFAIGVAQ